jgi:hypothetical protein
MTILSATGEDTGLVLSGNSTMISTSTSSQVRSSYARGGLRINPTTGDPPADRIAMPAFSASSTVWLHAQQGNSGNGNLTVSNQQMMRLLDGSVARILVRGTGTAGQLKISKRNSAGTITDLVTSSSGNFTSLSSGTTSFDLAVVYGTSGSATLYADGMQIATYSGDVTTDGATTLDGAELAGQQGTFFLYWSEMIVADEDTRSMALWTIAPQAAGNTQSWTPNTVGNINEVVINDATLISSSSNNQVSEWTTPTSAPSGAWAVKAIVQEARVQVGATGPQHFDWVVRTASTDYTAGVSNAPSPGFANFSNYRWATNPNTSAAWAITDITTGFNLGIKSLA